VKEDINRVTIEALEFDWIFSDDNIEKFITVLANLKNP